jgi:hypothetical protein
VLGRLARRKRLPPRRAAFLGVQRRPVHQVGRVFVWPEKEDFRVGPAGRVDDGALDAG